ncbi:topA DNA topoisomerase I [Bifidobacterium actinocoloniiforme DSM 22766]|uniref:DNA topoisomerase 1 n=1 Tax=Bifidobacterium actinocoloniiforme DSM 22766 TaxID=1437605 RepID=A0A086Z290_9BIFI|nr:type I DNA topoisomerase [Bifidobacterium actinocoloniiforme]KFI40640.1 topA DNA topoisomerase I [Bifidobacterium actinocoloniiforme DSM 22766]
MTHGNKLVIVESPAKAKKISGYLGPGYTVMASVGHIRDLAKPSQIPTSQKERFGKFGVDVDHDFKPYYIVDDNKKKTVSGLRQALKDADELYLATDEDREGEAIAWHLVQTLKPKVPVKRMVFHEITPEAIKDSLNHTRDVDSNMVVAQETRRVLDRLYGYELSPVLWRKVGPGLSAGRVQSVATRLIVERERERIAFVRAPYWDLVADLSAASDLSESGSDRFQARMVELGGKRLVNSRDFSSDGQLTASAKKDEARQLDQTLAERLAGELKDADFTVVGLDTKPYRRRPQPPFTTSTMQQTAGNRLGMSSRASMRAAQSLYENGYITYMRTDSVTLSQQAIAAARQSVEEVYGKQYLVEGPKQYVTKSAGAQEAHECIRPAGSHFHSPQELASSLPPDQLKLYTLIWQRTLASQMADATGSTATVRLSAPTQSEGESIFQASGTVIQFPGFMKAMGFSAEGGKGGKAEGDGSLPPVSQGQRLKADSVEPEGHETQPPARYTEASLVKTLEAKEIGRPSTYASIISTIIDRGYVYERGRALIPSWLAFSVIKLLETNFPQYVDYRFTAQMENGLDQIAHGTETGTDWLTRFYFGSGPGAARNAQEAHRGLQEQVAQLGEIDAHQVNTIPIGEGFQVRVGRYGPYLEDSAHLDDKGNPKRASLPDTLAPDELTVAKARELIETNSGGPRVLGTDSSTGGRVELRKGRFGPYLALITPEVDAAMKEAEERKAAGKKATEPKPKMASLFKSMNPETVTLDDALKLLSLPREVGQVSVSDAKTGQSATATVTASNGRYGPYLTATKPDGSSETRSLASEDEIFTVDQAKAQELFSQPKYGRRSAGAAKPPLRELGPDPDTGKPVTIKDGFYGAYITDGETNRTLPKQYTPASVEPEVAFRLLAEKRAAGPTKRRKRTATRKSAAKGTASKKTGAKKTATEKATAKKTAAEKTTVKRAATKTASTRKSTATKAAGGKASATKPASARKSTGASTRRTRVATSSKGASRQTSEDQA